MHSCFLGDFMYYVRDTLFEASTFLFESAPFLQLEGKNVYFITNTFVHVVNGDVVVVTNRYVFKNK